VRALLILVLLSISPQSPSSSTDNLVQVSMSALWVLLSHPGAMREFEANDGLHVVAEACANRKGMDVHLAFAGILRMVALTREGAAEVVRSGVAGRVCGLLKTHAR
jgi:hypothetical protein